MLDCLQISKLVELTNAGKSADDVFARPRPANSHPPILPNLIHLMSRCLTPSARLLPDYICLLVNLKRLTHYNNPPNDGDALDYFSLFTPRTSRIPYYYTVNHSHSGVIRAIAVHLTLLPRYERLRVRIVQGKNISPWVRIVRNRNGLISRPDQTYIHMHAKNT